MAQNPWVKFYPSDWLGATGILTPSERGIYITLIALMYDRAGPLPNDPARLSRLCGCPKAAFQRALDTLTDEGMILISDEGLFNKRVSVELDDFKNRSENARTLAKKRWSAQEEKDQQKQRPEDAERNAPRNAKPEARSQKPEYNSDFDDFWSAYPHGTNRPSKSVALKSYSRALKETDHQTIMAATADYGAFLAKQRSTGFDQSPKQITTWLNQKCWEAEYGITPSKPKREPPNGWREAVMDFKHFGKWVDDWGPRPDDPRCQIDEAILRGYGYKK